MSLEVCSFPMEHDKLYKSIAYLLNTGTKTSITLKVTINPLNMFLYETHTNEMEIFPIIILTT